MKRFLFITTLSSVVFMQGVYAATGTTVASTSSTSSAVAKTSTGKMDRFEIQASNTAKVGEKMDITVKALTKDGAVKSDYQGTIFFSIENDSRAEYPFPDGYTFLPTDQGVRLFSKGLSFTSEGKKRVTVFDIETDSIQGILDVTVTAGSSSQPSGSEVVTLVTPEANSTLSSSTFDITGSARKNSKIEVMLNDAKYETTQTDDKGTYFLKIKDVKSGINALEVKLLDGTDKVIGTTGKVAFTVANEGPKFISASIKEGNKIPVSSQLNVEVQAEPKVKEVILSLGDSTQVLIEGKSGLYTGSITAPSQSGSYSLGVTLKNDLGKTTSVPTAQTIEVFLPPVSFKNIKALNSGERITFSFEADGLPKEVEKFVFVYSTGALDAKSKETVTIEKSKFLSGSVYSWYIPNLQPAPYNFKIYGALSNGTKLETASSEVIPVDLSLNAAANCTISNISDVKVTKDGNKSILSWKRIPEALSYNVYKKDSKGEFVLIENVKDEKYTIYIKGESLTYDDFAIKAMCSDGKTVSTNFSVASRVQTGPGLAIAILVFASILAFLIQRRNLFIRN